MESQEVSRQSLHRRKSRFVKELKSINFSHLLVGSLVIMKKTCGKKECHCWKKGEGHLALYLSFAKKMYFLPASIKKKAKEYNTNYHKVKELMRKISLCNLQLLKRRSHGKSHYRKTKPSL